MLEKVDTRKICGWFFADYVTIETYCIDLHFTYSHHPITALFMAVIQCHEKSWTRFNLKWLRYYQIWIRDAYWFFWGTFYFVFGEVGIVTCLTMTDFIVFFSFFVMFTLDDIFFWSYKYWFLRIKYLIVCCGFLCIYI